MLLRTSSAEDVKLGVTRLEYFLSLTFVSHVFISHDRSMKSVYVFGLSAGISEPPPSSER